MTFRKSLFLTAAALSGLAVVTAAHAQSTASQEVEVIVKGSKKGIGPVNKETGPKTKTVIDQDYISAQSSGQTIADTLNIAPGYNFTNNDPYGSSGGNVRLRGLDGSRVSLTMDGVQLNDAGNYAIYTNQQLDPELISAATIVTGATDVDSMTASATGGTINYTTRKTSDTFGVETTLSKGTFDYSREFFLVDTGKFGPWGTQAWVAYSNQNYNTFMVENPDNGKLHKQQVNFNVYQPLDNGSYFGLRGNYNVNRNRFIFSQTAATYAANGLYYSSAGPNNINPSNNGNLRGYSKWVINDQFFVTVDPTYQYVLANGGGTGSIRESDGRMSVSSRTYYYKELAGVDINKDGDTSDTVTVYNPNTTQTDRFSLSSTGVFTFKRGDVLRFGVSLDRARTKQTGESTLLNADGRYIDPFGAKSDDSLAIIGSDGSVHERRNRFSKADVDTFSLEYRGRFLDDKLFVSIGVKQQRMERELHQYCYSPDEGSGSYAPYCTTATPTTVNANGTVGFGYTYLTSTSSGSSIAHTAFIKPYVTTVSFSKTLPSLGATYKLNDNNQVYANYSESMSSPRTDNYYGVVVVDGVVKPANPLPETNKTFELGYRYTAEKINASLVGWQSKYDNRIVSTYDASTDSYFDRNVGRVDLKGLEGSFNYAATPRLALFSGATYTETEILDNYNSSATVVVNTKGKALPEVPRYMATLGATYRPFPDLSLSLFGKYVGKRFSTDINDAFAPAYTTWNGTLRYNLSMLNAGTYVQLNVINLTDKYYYGSISTAVNAASGPAYYAGAPRTVMLSLHAKLF